MRRASASSQSTAVYDVTGKNGRTAAERARQEPVIIVDEHNRRVGIVPRHEMRARRLPHRATYIFVFDTRGRLLVQKRTDTKDMYPGFYDLAAGGVVAAGESYAESARREAEEELGIRDTALAECFEFYYEDEKNRCFGQVFTCTHDGPFSLQPEEVASAEFYDLSEILAGRIEPVTPDTLSALHRLLKFRQG